MDKLPVPYLPSLGRLLGFASRAATTLAERRLAKHDLTIQQWIALTALWREDGLTIGQISNYCRIREPTGSSLIDRMQVKGLVERRHSQTDRRSVTVHLTDKGRQMEALIDFYSDINARLLVDFKDSEKKALFAMLERVIDNAERELSHEPPTEHNSGS